MKTKSRHRVWECVLAFLLASAAARAQVVDVAVDGTAPGGKLNPVWSYFGYDEVNITTEAESQRLLAALTQMMEPTVRIRTHFLLNSKSGSEGLKWGATDVYREDALGKPIYDWTVMDQIMDTIVMSGARPYAQVAFMPQALTRATGPYRNSAFDALDGGLFYPPKADAWGRWAGLVKAWAEHTKARYPDAESTWIWELWNEPNIGYWHGTAAEYDQLYDYTEQALHQVMPQVPLGGPETAGVGGDFLRNFLKHCETGPNTASGQAGTRIDFISFHAKGGVDISGGHVRMSLGNQLKQHLDGFKIVAATARHQKTPIVIGEADPDGCAACSAPPANAYRTTAAYGVYELAMMKHTLALAAQTGVNLQGVTTWAWMFKQQPYFANLRQLQTNGVPLPVLNAYKLLGALKGQTLPLRSSGALGAEAIVAGSVRSAPDIDGMASGNDRQLQVILWNYHDDLVAAPPARLTVRVKVPPAFGPAVKLTRLAFDETNGSSTAKWVELGKPATPSPDQVKQLQAASALAVAEPNHEVLVQGGEVTDTFDLPRSGATLLLIDKPSDASTGGGGAGGQSASGDAGAAGTAGVGTTSVAGTSTSGAPAGGAFAGGSGGAGQGGLAGASPVSGAGNTGSAGSEAAAGCNCRAGRRSAPGSHWMLALGLLAVKRRGARQRRHSF